MNEDNGQPKQQVAVLPWEMHFMSFGFDFEPRDDGGMTLAVMPGLAQPTGFAVMPPAVKIHFGKELWEMFQRRVTADGKDIPVIPIARVVPQPPAR